MSWKAIARNEVGTSHQKLGLPCQDFADFRILDDVIIGAVADGAGSAKYSDIGAKLAVEATIKYLAEFSQSFEKRIQKRKFWEQSYSQAISEKTAKKRFKNVLKKVNTALQQQADSKDYSVNDLACTLLVFVATPYWVAAMQIGDGFIVVRPQNESSQYQMLFQPDKGEFANETTFVTSVNALDDMQIKVFSEKPEFICASTDGLEKVAIRFSDWKPFPPFFKPLEEYLQETDKPQEEGEYIVNFLKCEQLNARTDDDKTLLLCLFGKSEME